MSVQDRKTEEIEDERNTDIKNKSPEGDASGINELPGTPKKRIIRKSITPRASSTRPSSAKALSSIPLPVKPQKSPDTVTPRIQPASKISRPSNASISKCGPQINNKHTLEIQFINKKKRLKELKNELLDKQKPVLDLYQNLLQLKKQLGGYGKNVQLEEIKLVPYACFQQKGPPRESIEGAGESVVHVEGLSEMKASIQEIPKTLMTICQNLVQRRAVIVDLLESVTNSEVDVSEISDKIEALKFEGCELQKSLDAIVNEHEEKISLLVTSWEKVLSGKTDEIKNDRIEELEEQLKQQEKLTVQSSNVIQELHKKLDEKRIIHEKSVTEMESSIKTLKEQVRKLEHEVEYEKKVATDHKTRNNNNAQTIKCLKNKVVDFETKNKEVEEKNYELNKKLKLAQDQLKVREAQWNRERDDLSKNLKQQEGLLQKITSDRSQFEARAKSAEEKKVKLEEGLKQHIEELKTELAKTKQELQESKDGKNILLDKCRNMEDHLAKLGIENREDIYMISTKIDWGKRLPAVGSGAESETEEYRDAIATKIMIRDYEDTIKQYELEKQKYIEIINNMADKCKQAPIIYQPSPTENDDHTLVRQQECIARYQRLLEESEDKLKEKSIEVSKLTAEIRHLKVRQDALEEQNVNCPTGDLQKMVDEGRQKLNELMKKSLESEQRISQYEAVIDKQYRQMNEMENLLRYRENMNGVLKSSRDDLIMEKESLTRYSQEMRTVLVELTKEGKMKDKLLKELHEKLETRERLISKLENDVRELESNLQMTNEKRFKLQETIGSMEKELQSTKANINHLADMQTRTRLKFIKPF